MDRSKLSLLAEVEAVTFDLDDTLWDCASVITKAEARLYEWMEANTPRVTEALSQDAMREHRMGMYQRFPELICDVTAMRKKSLSENFEAHGYAAETTDTAFDVFYQTRSQVVLYDGVLEMLNDLRNRYSLAAITNGNADLKIAGIAEYFRDFQCASLSNPPKPKPDMFIKSADALGVNLANILHIGDNPQTDVVGGNNAGTLTVWFNQTQAVWPEGLPRAHFEVTGINDLHKLLCN